MQIFTRFYLLLAGVVFFLFAPIMANADSIPTIIYSDQNGKKHTLDTSKNKLTAVHFWATWCKPCIKELPYANAAQKKFYGQGFKMIALSVDSSAEVDNVRKFYNEKNIDSLDLFFVADISIFQALRMRGLPTTIFVDSEGEIVLRVGGSVNWEDIKTQKFIEYQIARAGR